MRGLALSGGGIKAAAHIGALKALEEEGIEFDAVSGASSGSIVATMYAIGYNADEMWKMFQTYAPKIKYYSWSKILKLIYGLIFENKIVIEGLNSGKVINKIISNICLKDNIENINQIRMPLAIPMVDLHTGAVIVASSKEIRSSFDDNTKFISNIPIGTAVRASCSFPVVFSPCEFNNAQLIDGGTRENLPWKELKQLGADEVWGICFETVHTTENYSFNIIEVANRALELQGRELAIYEEQGIDKLLSIDLKKVSLLDASKMHELYYIGYEQTKKQICKTSFRY